MTSPNSSWSSSGPCSPQTAPGRANQRTMAILRPRTSSNRRVMTATLSPARSPSSCRQLSSSSSSSSCATLALPLPLARGCFLVGTRYEGGARNFCLSLARSLTTTVSPTRNSRLDSRPVSGSSEVRVKAGWSVSFEMRDEREARLVGVVVVVVVTGEGRRGCWREVLAGVTHESVVASAAGILAAVSVRGSGGRRERGRRASTRRDEVEVEMARSPAKRSRRGALLVTLSLPLSTLARPPCTPAVPAQLDRHRPRLRSPPGHAHSGLARPASAVARLALSSSASRSTSSQHSCYDCILLGTMSPGSGHVSAKRASTKSASSKVSPPHLSPASFLLPPTHGGVLTRAHISE